jgi:transcriptional regulator with XRE-family HTH domain
MASALGDFLVTSRSRIRPEDVGLREGGRRRVPGLRREEVAQLAGVSVDYYIRLEQGRETSPSPAVAESISRALRLDEYGSAHLYRLAGLTPPRADDTLETVDANLLALLSDWDRHPAIVLGTAFDVLAANALGEALFLGFPGTRNLLESVFLVPAARELYPDWSDVAENTVAGFRLLHAAQPSHPRIQQVLGRLTAESAEFRAMWADHLARGRRMPTKRFRHPGLGVFELAVETFDVRSAPGQELVLYRAAPGSAAEAALNRLAAGSAPAPEPSPDR